MRLAEVMRNYRDEKHLRNAVLVEKMKVELKQHGPACENPWCPKCYGDTPQLAGDGNYSP